MAFLEQEEMLAAQIRLRHAIASAERMLRGQGEGEDIVEQRQLLDFRLVERQSQNQEIERAGQQLPNQHQCLGLAQAQLQLRKRLVQARQDAGQEIGGDRGDHADAQRPAQHVGMLARHVREIPYRLQDGTGAPCDL
jgi:hypothetical protein